MRVLFVTQWFDPEPALKGASFAAALVAQGHKVEVATGFPNYPGGKLYPGYRLRPYRRDYVGGVLVHRLFLWPSHDGSAIGRALNYLSFFASTLLFGLVRGRSYDLVYVYHPPITPALATAVFCGLWRRPFVLEIQDLWPDSASASGMVPERLARLLDKLCRFVYRRAAAIIPQSDGMLARLAVRGVPEQRMTRIYNWSTYAAAARGDNEVSAAILASFAGHVNLVYGGNLGQAQALSHVVDAAESAARDEPAIRLHLFGEGIERDSLAKQIATRGLSDRIMLHDAVPRRAMDRIFDLADVLVLHLRDDPLYAITIPSKVQHYLSCGKPIVAGLVGEAARLLEESGAAIVTSPEDADAMASAFVRTARMSPAERAAMSDRGRDFYQERMAFGPAVDHTSRVIARATAGAAVSGDRP